MEPNSSDGIDESFKPQTKHGLLGSYFAPPAEWNFALPSFFTLLKWTLRYYHDASTIPSTEILDKSLPLHQHSEEELERLKKPPPRGCRVMWIGHASLLVQLNGMSILTDPVFSRFAGPIQSRFLGSLLGYKRYRQCGISVEQLPAINAVLISHNHYDHLDKNSVHMLNQRFNDKLTWLIPKGMKSWFVKRGCQNVIELSWWEKYALKAFPETKFIFTPAQHWSIRSGLDQFATLWGSWVVIGPQTRFFFAGDTGYNDKVFKEIGRRYGPFNLAAIPIGAYKPREVMRCQHIDPKEAVRIHQDVQAKKSVGIHWGTFRLTNEAYDEPPKELEKQMRAQDLPHEDFFTLKHGEIKLITDEECGESCTKSDTPQQD